MSTQIKEKYTKTILVFTPSERLHLVAQALLNEFSSDNPEQIESMWDLVTYLHYEKERLLKVLVAGNQDIRSLAWKQLDEVNKDLFRLESSINQLIKIEQEA